MEINYLKGVGVALVTPFCEDGSVDLEALHDHVKFQIDGNVGFMVPCGTTGESATLSIEEHSIVVRETANAAQGKVPILAGAGGNNTADVILRARAVKEAGANAIVSVSPAYNKPSQRGIVEHYRALAAAVECPIVVYNVPGRTSSNILPETLMSLAEIDNIVGVKEASSNISQIMTIIRERPQGFLVLSGDDYLTLPLIAAGADGVISVVANEAPGLMSGMVSAALRGDYKEARELHYRLLPLMNINFIETNPVPAKAALAMMGRMEARYRLPLVPLDTANEPSVRQALVESGILESRVAG